MKNYIDKKIVGELWSFNKYGNSYKSVDWEWRNLPFTDNLKIKDPFNFKVTKDFRNISILEIGSSMGRGYQFLKDQKNIDTKNFSGIEVSNTAIDYCKKNFTDANWIHANLDEFELEKKYDYSYERHSIHHMPNPLKQYEKILSKTNFSFTTTFRGCVHGETISDLDVGYFIEEKGKYFMNIINFTDVILIGIKNGFNNIRVDYRGLHEEIPKERDEKRMVLTDKVDRNKKLISRFIISFRKDVNSNKISLYLIKKKIYSPKYFFIINKINKHLKRIEKIFNF